MPLNLINYKADICSSGQKERNEKRKMEKERVGIVLAWGKNLKLVNKKPYSQYLINSFLTS